MAAIYCIEYFLFNFDDNNLWAMGNASLCLTFLIAFTKRTYS